MDRKEIVRMLSRGARREFISARIEQIVTIEGGLALKPMVLEDFNGYVHVINLYLPESFQLLESKRATYRCQEHRFYILTGKVRTPKGISRGPFKFGGIITDLCAVYESQTSWAKIKYGFKV